MTPLNSASPALDTWTELSGFQQCVRRRAATTARRAPRGGQAVRGDLHPDDAEVDARGKRQHRAATSPAASRSIQYRDMFDQQLSLIAVQRPQRPRHREDAGAPARRQDPMPAAAPRTRGQCALPLPHGRRAMRTSAHCCNWAPSGDRADGADAGDAPATSAITAMPSTADAPVGMARRARSPRAGALERAGDGRQVAARATRSSSSARWRRTRRRRRTSSAYRCARCSRRPRWKPAGASTCRSAGDGAAATICSASRPAAAGTATRSASPRSNTRTAWRCASATVPRLRLARRMRSPTTPDLLGDNPRYAQALGQGENIAGFARALLHGGYATDPALRGQAHRDRQQRADARGAGHLQRRTASSEIRAAVTVSTYRASPAVPKVLEDRPMADILSTGVSGLLASQIGLSTVEPQRLQRQHRRLQPPAR